MPAATNPGPFTRLDKGQVVDVFKATGSRDPDILYAHKLALLSPQRLPRVAGVACAVGGGLALLTPAGALAGVPLLGIGGWLYRRGRENSAAVEAGYQEYLHSMR